MEAHAPTLSGAAQLASASHEIRPPGRWPGLGLREVWEYRELLYFLTKREIQIRYKQSLFGVAWAVLQPVAYAFIFTLFFGRLAEIPSEGLPYPIFALSALVAWLFNSQAVASSAEGLVGDADLLGKVYFPRLAIPIAKILSFLVDLVIALCVVMLFVFAYGASPSIGMIALPGFLLLAFLTAFGVGTFLAALNVKYRDVKVAVPLFVQMWLFATPVVYPGTLITGAWQYIYALNPMVSVIAGCRWALVGTDPPDPGVVAVSTVSAVIAMLAALVYFRRTERFFADVI